MSPGGIGLGGRVALILVLAWLAGVIAWLASAGVLRSADARAWLAGGVGVLVGLAVRGFVARPSAVARAVSDGLLAYAERDYSLRLASEADPWQLGRRFNALGDQLRREHNDVYQKQMLLETVLGATPTAMVLENEAGRVVYANGTARELLGDGRPLEGRGFAELLGELAPELREALAGPVDTLFSIERDGVNEVYDLARRFFHINTQRHRLTMIRPLGPELERREAEAWKKAIRVISHELNNSLAPVSSLAHSARALVGEGAAGAKLGKVFDTIEERARHLTGFLDGFARVARLPRPRAEEVAWAPFLASVQALHAFTLDGATPEASGWFDRAQLQQVLINLVKNAHEAGSAPEEVRVRVETVGGGGVKLTVLDRGAGMAEEVRRNALLPFYSTKKTGAGIGLSLCREIVDAHGGRLTLLARDGGGTAVEIQLPGRA